MVSDRHHTRDITENTSERIGPWVVQLCTWKMSRKAPGDILWLHHFPPHVEAVKHTWFGGHEMKCAMCIKVVGV
jgi:hypothetical protein